MFHNEALELDRLRRTRDRWQTEFGRWEADFCVPRIIVGPAHDPDLRVTNQPPPGARLRGPCPHLGHLPPLCPLKGTCPRHLLTGRGK